jgi:demethylmenaquinone methyltransferase/2-methoxy-6-polyprenyl-1,4-benzoquinol methylase
MRWLYRLHLGMVVPIVGKLLLGNPENYRMLWRYTSTFGNCRGLAGLFAESGFDLHYVSLFGGCATALVGHKPNSLR